MNVGCVLSAAVLCVALAGCTKSPVSCSEFSAEATSSLIAQHLKSGFTNTEARTPLETAIKVPADFSKLLTISPPAIETVSQAPDGNSASCVAHFEALASPEIQQIIQRWKGQEGQVRAFVEVARRSQAGDDVGDDGYFQFASRRLTGTVKVLREYAEVNPEGGILPSEKFRGTLKYVLTRGDGRELRSAVTSDAVAPKWAQALAFYPQFEEWMAERTSAAERKELYGAFEVLSPKKVDLCGEEAICIETDRRQVVMNGAAMDKQSRELLDVSAKSGATVCFTGVEKSEGKFIANGVVNSCK